MATKTIDAPATLPDTRPDWMPGDADPKTLEQTKPLKLSEALRFGAMGTTQTFSKLGDTDAGTACGVGAVFVGLGYQFSGPNSVGNVIAAHPELRVLQTPVRLIGRMPEMCVEHRGFRRPDDFHASYSSHGENILDAIIHLNDDHHLPREQIASWLEGLGL